LIHVDGSQGEGGGQVLRNAVALSVLTDKPVEIEKIRANRPNPGIKAQHYIAIKSIQDLCNADAKGLEVGSDKLTFIPGEIKGGNHKFDIGTAGSIVLVFQACILACLNITEPVTLNVTGGTDVRWSPSWDYFENVFLPLVNKMNFSVESKLIKRGYYPKGGGEAEITIKPTGGLKPLKLDGEPEYNKVKGVISLANLPDHISTRMKHSVIKTLLKRDLNASVDIQKTYSLSAGTGIALWVKSKNALLGSSFLGERGIPAEKVGENAATDILNDIDSEATIDIHAFDQILPYMVLARNNGDSSCIVRSVSGHAQTNIWLLKQFYDVDIELFQEDDNFKVLVQQSI
jgi:RNA 3'-phosphate cyclase